MNLEQVRKLGSLSYQLKKEMGRLASVQRRLLEVLAELSPRDNDIHADALLTLEGEVGQAMLQLALMREHLSAARLTQRQQQQAQQARVKASGDEVIDKECATND